MSERELIPQPHGGALLTPFQKGQSGNPEGRKTYGAYIKEHWNALMLRIEKGELSADDIAYIAKNDVNYNRQIAAQRILNSKLDLNEFREMMDRTDGKTRQEVTGTDGGPIQHEIKIKFDDRG